ncbi:MAG TPA: putative quinol monooxygenase [Mucilaginibacter sp.]|jgi:quinol monooxygenase YgiN
MAINKTLFIFIMMLFSSGIAVGQQKNQIVRIAKIQVDSVQLESYKAALKEEIETSLRIESGVLTLYAVSEKKHPSHITIFETYADTAAYQSHLQTPHFKKYKDIVKNMVTSLELVEVDPIVVRSKTGK